MKFDDHEIWGAPVRPAEASEPAPEPAQPQVAPVLGEGRLYRSAGSDPHPGAIVALPAHSRHTTAQPIPSSQWVAPIAISSLIPKPLPVEDAAIAEVLSTGPAAVTPSGFTSWFKAPTPLAEPSVPRSKPAAVAGRPNTITARAFTTLVFAVTVLAGTANALLADGLGLPTGVALLAATAVGSSLLDRASRWAAWAMPAYALIAAILVAGQLTTGAPGFSPLGQLLLVGTDLIALAPWLAASTLLGAVLPRLRQS